jgi:hypothetical protein
LVGGDILKDPGALIIEGKAVQEDWTAWSMKMTASLSFRMSDQWPNDSNILHKTWILHNFYFPKLQ